MHGAGIRVSAAARPADWVRQCVRMAEDQQDTHAMSATGREQTCTDGTTVHCTHPDERDVEVCCGCSQEFPKEDPNIRPAREWPDTGWRGEAR